MPQPNTKICVGMVVGAHGTKGAVRIKPFTAEPKGIAAYGPVSDEDGTRRFTVTVLGHARSVVTARLSGIAERSAAEALKGLRLYIQRSALPTAEAEEFYHADLVGLTAERADGTRVGQVAAVRDHGGGTYLEIVGSNRRPLIVPFTRRAVPVVDLAAGKLVIEPPVEIEAGPEEKPE